jgi:myo-inositol-1(or 4)-monophosphatase
MEQDRVLAPVSGGALDDLLALAVEAAARAGDLLMTYFDAPAAGVGSKSSPTDLVSDADRAAEKLLLETIERPRPHDGVLAVEGGARDSTSGYTWVVDPLDGTINFLFGIPVWSVSVAVQDETGTAVGVVHDPCRGETFAARRDAGATLNGRRIDVSAESDLATALVGTGFSYEPEARARQAEVLARVLPRVRDIRRGGSAALDLAAVSCGRLDGFYEAPMEPWDKAAGMLLVTEAGGIVTELDPPVPRLSRGVVAAGRALHDSLSELVLDRA